MIRVAWLALAGLLLAPLAVWVSELGNPWYTLSQEAPPGQAVYLASRLIGLYAVALLWLQVLAGLQMRRLQARWSREDVLAWHIPQGLAALGFTLLHPALFWLSIRLRAGKSDWAGWLTPTFSHGYYQSMQTLGRLALLLVVAGTLAALLRRRPGWLHRLNVAAFALVLIHSFTIGSDTRAGALPAFYAAMALSSLLVPSLPFHPRNISRVLFAGQALVLIAALVPAGAELAGRSARSVPTIPGPELARSISAGPGVAVVDVREPGEYVEEHIPGAVNCPVRDLDERSGELLGKAERVVVYCLKDFRGFEGLRRLRRYHGRVELIHGYGLSRWKKDGFVTAGLLCAQDDAGAMALLRRQVR